MTATAADGIEAFDINHPEEWEDYAQRFEFFLEAQSITDAAKKRVAFLGRCGPATFQLAKALVVRPSLNHLQDSSKKGKRSSALRALASFQVLEGTVDNSATIVSEDSDFAPSDAEDEQDYDSWDDDLMVCEEDRPAVEAPLVILQRAWQGRYEAPQQPTARIDPKLVAKLGGGPGKQCLHRMPQPGMGAYF
ncbi:hypothetical protein HPB52_007266 [Rhipicephalus sanguineus]|uniref:Uncharacterized protein n=1 Tax=Rhipicephalus sanguineus TaxID=34632 RepID=A0A9D4Q5E5_RHISA|nr:hypothetical protein HPB52_007266 [Rhipicephalus sanguineus]